MASANGESYRLTAWPGAGRVETHSPVQEPVTQGKRVLEKRRGKHVAPGESLVRRRPGGCGGRGATAASVRPARLERKTGTRREQTPNSAGAGHRRLQRFRFRLPAEPGERLETPLFYAGYTEDGFGDASRRMHRFEREEILPDRAAPKVRPLLYNSWEATEFSVDEAGQKALADKAAKSASSCL